MNIRKTNWSSQAKHKTNYVSPNERTNIRPSENGYFMFTPNKVFRIMATIKKKRLVVVLQTGMLTIKFINMYIKSHG